MLLYQIVPADDVGAPSVAHADREINRITDAFREADTNGNGHLSPAELARAQAANKASMEELARLQRYLAESSLKTTAPRASTIRKLEAHLASGDLRKFPLIAILEKDPAFKAWSSVRVSRMASQLQRLPPGTDVAKAINSYGLQDAG